MPLKKQFPFLFKLLMQLTPYDYDYTLDAGGDYTIFKMPVGGQTYRFGVMICFEDTIPQVSRKLSVGKTGKRADWLVNITNDGWFVRQSGSEIKASAELSQHLAACVFRAVENRLSTIRCANTGISCLIDSTGKIKNNLRAGKREWFTDTVMIDVRQTVFSRSGGLLGISCGICLLICLAAGISEPRPIRALSVSDG
jgi:apolipoprotein N-acyltransferase